MRIVITSSIIVLGILFLSTISETLLDIARGISKCYILLHYGISLPERIHIEEIKT